MKRLLLAVLALGLVAFAGQPAQASDIVIDNFNTSSTTLVTGGTSPPSTITGPVDIATADAIAGFRTVTVTRTLGAGDAKFRTNTGGDGLGAFSTDAGTAAIYDLLYDANGAGLGLAVDPSWSIDLDVRADQNPATAAITVEDGLGNFDTIPFVIPGLPLNTFQTISIPLQDFAGLDFTSGIRSITLTIGAGGGAGGSERDGQIDNFIIRTPEPTSLAIFGLTLVAGIGGASYYRRRCFSQA